MSPHRRFAMTLAVFATATYFALVVCAFGFVSLLTDTDPIPQAEAGRLLGPAMVAAAVLVVLAFLLLRAPRLDFGGRRSAPGFSALVGVAAWGTFLIVGAVGYAVTTGGLLEALVFAMTTAYGFYAIAVAASAWLIVWLTTVLLASRREDRGRPLWPWERDEED
jgi:hypothetical protein